MQRRVAFLAAMAVCGLLLGGVAFAQKDDEFQLPPVKLKPERPSPNKPIPPAPDEREAPKDLMLPPPPADIAPPPLPPAPPAKKPAETPKETPPAPPAKKPAETPKETPPPIKAPKELAPPVIEKPPELPPLPSELPAEPAKKPAPSKAPKAPKAVEPAPLPPPELAPAPKAPAKAPKAAETPMELMPSEAPKPAPKAPAKAPKAVAPPMELTPLEAPKPAPKAPKAVEPLPPPPELMPTEVAPKAPAKAPAMPPPAETEPVLPPPPVAKPLKTEIPVEVPAPRPTDLQAELMGAQVEPGSEIDLIGMGEVGLVEEVVRARKAYARGLQALALFYKQQGQATKSEWAKDESDTLSRVPKMQYLGVAELAGPNLRPLRSIPAADQLYREGINYKDYPAFPPTKKDYLKVALEKFQTIVEKYPESDKIADAAFRLGEIYGGWYFNDWARAVEAYERCWQWDQKTQNPALFNAAKIYDEKLKNRVKAVELYNRVISESQNEDLVKQARDRIKALTGK